MSHPVLVLLRSPLAVLAYLIWFGFGFPIAAFMIFFGLVINGLMAITSLALTGHGPPKNFWDDGHSKGPIHDGLSILLLPRLIMAFWLGGFSGLMDSL